MQSPVEQHLLLLAQEERRWPQWCNAFDFLLYAILLTVFTGVLVAACR